MPIFNSTGLNAAQVLAVIQASAFADHADVQLTNIQTNDVLGWNGVTNQWDNYPRGGTTLWTEQAVVDFGSDSGPITRLFDAYTVVSASWVTATSKIVCSLAGIATATHGAMDGLIEGITVQAESLVAGVGFTVHAYSPQGSWGYYVFNCVGD